MFKCTCCGLDFEPNSPTIDEIVSCPDCGTDFVFTKDGMKELNIIGEDWGE